MAKPCLSLLGISLAALTMLPLSAAADSPTRAEKAEATGPIDFMLTVTKRHDGLGGMIEESVYLDAIAYQASVGSVMNGLVPPAQADGSNPTACTGSPTLATGSHAQDLPEPPRSPADYADYIYSTTMTTPITDDAGVAWCRSIQWKREIAMNPDGTAAPADWRVCSVKYGKDQLTADGACFSVN